MSVVLYTVKGKMISLKSKVSRGLLSYLFLHENESLYLNEIARKLGIDKRNLAKKIKEFSEEGLIVGEQKGNEIYYSLNKRYPFFKEYKKIILKTYGIEKHLGELLRQLKGIKEAYIIGSYAQNNMDTHSDIDVLVVGDINTVEVQKKVAEVQIKVSREINLTVISPVELKRKLDKRDPFLDNVFKSPRIKLV